MIKNRHGKSVQYDGEGRQKMDKKFEELELRDDFMFGVVMRNPKYCKPFLETIFGIKISHIEYPESQKTIEIAAEAKGVRLDVYVEDGKGTVYNIEMQTTTNRDIKKRMRYYQSMIDLNILEKGATYKELKRSFVIFVCTFDLFEKGRHVYTFENRCVQELDLPLGDDTTKIILNTKGTIDDVSPEMKRLLNFIDGQEPEDDFTKELAQAVEAVRKNEKWRLDYMTLQMHYQEKFEEGVERGIAQGIEQGLAQGLAQGREQGIEQEREEAAERMLDDNLPPDKVARFSGLDLDKVLELKRKREAKLQLV